MASLRFADQFPNTWHKKTTNSQTQMLRNCLILLSQCSSEPDSYVIPEPSQNHCRNRISALVARFQRGRFPSLQCTIVKIMVNSSHSRRDHWSILIVRRVTRFFPDCLRTIASAHLLRSRLAMVDSQTDRQTDRRTERQTDRRTDRQTCRHTYRQFDSMTDR